MNTLDNSRLIDLPKVVRSEGSITAVHSSVEIPFDIARVFYIYDVPGGASRAGHAHKELHEVLVSIIGSFDVTLDDGTSRRTVTLSRAHYGLHVPSGLWTELSGFSSGAVCLALASDSYKDEDYIRDYEEYLRFRHASSVS